jgi:sigma-B regulation protein RsbU (phosphoserine phosphatase)
LIAETMYKLVAVFWVEIRDTLDLDKILNYLLDMVRSVVEYDAAGIFVLNKDFMEPRKKPTRGLIGGIATRGFGKQPPNLDPMLSAGKGIVGHVIRTCESVVASDVRNDSRYVEGRQGTRSEIAVPIMRNERAIGALNLESNRVAAYDRGNLEILQFVADAAAIAIEKVMLHRQILEKERIEEQLAIAHQVQSRLLPDGPPDVPGYDIAGTCISTFEIGGDYFDFMQLPNDRIGVVVADVSGKGIPAALIMTAFRALLRAQVRQDVGPEHIACSLKEVLPDLIGDKHFVTSVYGVLDPSDGRFTYVNCGHIAPMLFRSGGGVERLKIGGPVLSGALRDMSYNAHEIELARGDVLVLYTDGVVDIGAEDGDEFGLERLKTTVQGSLDLSALEMIHELIRATREFYGSNDYKDDFTIVIIWRE